MKGISNILVLGGVIAAGYLLLQSGGEGGGGTVQYIRNIPRAVTPEVKEAPPAPTIIQFPSETVNFPAPELPSVTSLLPTIPTTQPVTKTQPVASTPKKVAKTTSTTTTETFTYGETESGEMATTTEIKKQKEKLTGTPLAEYFERVGHGGKVTIPTTSKKETTKKSELNIPSMWDPQASFYEQIGGITGGESSIVRTTPKKSTAKTVSHRSRAAFVRSFGWK
ncbi:MAG: hypothetical protein DRI61_08005 [Chloroflexi bacterium]|nr:MAG: hypothetical protein DRI61_08005 [Chloroflexota bacterium]